MKKKLLAVMLVVVMVLGSFSAVFAAPTEITITMAAKRTNHTYEIYQIFKGDINVDNAGTLVDDKLIDLVYGSNAKAVADDPATTDVDESNPRTLDTAVTAADMEAIAGIAGTTYTSDQAAIAALSDYVDLSGAPAYQLGKVGDETIGSVKVPSGYYLIKDKDNSLTNPDSYTLYMLQVVNEDFTIVPKDAPVESHKNVDDKNDSNTSEDEVVWQNTADYDIGDHVPYKLTFTLPTNYADYKDYYVQFVDDMCEGLTLDADSVKIYFGTNDTTGQAISFTTEGTSQYTNGTRYVYTIEDLKADTYASKNIAAGMEIRIEYTATLNDKAVIGNDGNENEYFVKYSNNPNKTGHGNDNPPGETPEETNVVFTYEVVVNKLDGKQNPLTGADFDLYKFVADENGEETYKEVKGAWVLVTALGDTKHPTKVVSDKVVGEGAAAVTTEDCVFTFTGIDDGEYKLVEKTTPTGYNGIPDQFFTITAAHSDETLKITELTGTGDITLELNPNLDSGSLKTDIVNNSGAVMPETGGIGTTILYTLGGILVVGAGVLLVARRKMER